MVSQPRITTEPTEDTHHKDKESQEQKVQVLVKKGVINYRILKCQDQNELNWQVPEE